MSSLKNYTKFQGVNNIGETSLMSEIETNLKAWMDWAFLEIGAWFDVSINASGAYGGDFSTLRMASDSNYTEGQVWETFRRDMVWESGLHLSSAQPIQVSGVWVDDTFYESDDATYGHYVDYPNGRIVFDSAISTSAKVQLEYSYRWVQTHHAETPWWQQLHYRSFRVDDDHFKRQASGQWDIGPHHRVQMPAVVIEPVAQRTFTPYEMGNSSHWVRQNVVFNIVAETKWERNQLADILSVQDDKVVWFFDTNAMRVAEDFPLDSRGEKVGKTPPMYPDLVSETGYRWQKCRFINTTINEVESPNPGLFMAKVLTTLEMVSGNI